jgi:anti-sigma regulatory factor (Ser/Thr protein kinase)
VAFGEKIEFDLSLLKWVCPLLILPVSAYIKDTQSEFKINKCSIKSYLTKIGFPDGINSVSSLQRFRTYIPISVLSKDGDVDRERMEALFSEKIYETLGSISGAQNAICYPIAELVTNIFEHSKKNLGFIFAQFYPKKNYLDVCIVDCGRGFARTYKEEKGLNLTDEKALVEAMKGNSVKRDKERGYGIRTSKDVVCNALKGGGFILISGSCALVSVKQKEKLVSLPDFYWKGSIIAYRIPKPTEPIDIYRYLE